MHLHTAINSISSATLKAVSTEVRRHVYMNEVHKHHHLSSHTEGCEHAYGSPGDLVGGREDRRNREGREREHHKDMYRRAIHRYSMYRKVIHRYGMYMCVQQN